MGYLHAEEETQEAFNSDFKLRTGDLAKCDKRNFFFITGDYHYYILYYIMKSFYIFKVKNSSILLTEIFII